jgi:hypothetical protein
MSNTIHALNRRRSDETFSESTRWGEFKYAAPVPRPHRRRSSSPMRCGRTVCLELIDVMEQLARECEWAGTCRPGGCSGQYGLILRSLKVERRAMAPEPITYMSWARRSACAPLGLERTIPVRRARQTPPRNA